MTRAQFDLSSPQGSQRYLWGLFVLINVTLLIDELQLVGQHLFLVFFLIRLTQTFLAFFAATAVFFRKEISGDFLSLYIVFLIAVGACTSLFDPSEIILRLSINTFFYLLLAASFSGSIKDWLQIYLPVASLLLLAPVGLKATYLLHFDNLYFVFASLACSNGIVFIRSYLAYKTLDGESDFMPVDALGTADSSALEAHLDNQSSVPISRANMEFFNEGPAPSTDIISYSALINLLNEIVGQKQLQYRNLVKTKISAFAPRTGPQGFGIRTEMRNLKPVLIQLIDEAVTSLGMQTGFVRINVQLTLRQMLLMVEDNGRGVSKEALQRLKLKSLQKPQNLPTAEMIDLVPQEMRALFQFWGAEFEIATRLGVGRRVCMSFPLEALSLDEVVQSLEEFTPYSSNEATMIH